MNKKTKWGIIILVGAGIIGGGIYSQLPKKNDELAAADKVMSGNQKRGKQVLNVNAKVIKPQSLTDEFTLSLIHISFKYMFDLGLFDTDT